MGAGAFERRGGGGYVAHLDATERGVLVTVVDEVVELLGGDHGMPDGDDPLEMVQLGVSLVPAPTDPALLRLLPDASRADAAVAAEFRRLTEEELRRTKVGNLLRLRAALLDAGPVDAGPVDSGPAMVLQPGEAPSLAAALTDLRLVLAERLGVSTEADADELHRLAVQGDPAEAETGEVTRRFLALVYDLLTLLQDSLVWLMLDDLPGDGEPDPRRPPR